MATNNDKGSLEASLVGIGFGAVLGAMVVGSAADALGSPIHSMLAYPIGGVLGAAAGFIVGRLAASMLLE